MHLHHGSLIVSDLDRTLAFYSGLLGFPIVTNEVRMSEAQDKILGVADSKIRLAMIDVGKAWIEIIQS